MRLSFHLALPWAAAHHLHVCSAARARASYRVGLSLQWLSGSALTLGPWAKWQGLMSDVYSYVIMTVESELELQAQVLSSSST